MLRCATLLDMFTEHQVAQRQLHPVVRVRHLLRHGAPGSRQQLGQRGAQRQLQVLARPRGHQRQARGQQVLEDEEPGQADPLIQRPPVLEYSEGEVAGRAGGPGLEVQLRGEHEVLLHQLQLRGRGVVTQRRQLGQALRAGLAGRSTAQYGRNFRNISSSDISTLFREHLRYISLK